MRARRAAIRDLYHERQVSLQCAPGGGQDAGLMEAAVHVPSWFVREELGFAIEHGPSAEWYAANLAAINAANRKVLADQERPKVLAAERRRRHEMLTPLQYARRFQRAIAKADAERRRAG